MAEDTGRLDDPSSSDDEQIPSSPAAEVRRQSAEPVLPRRSADEHDIGWGDEPTGYNDDWYRDQRPPHHG